MITNVYQHKSTSVYKAQFDWFKELVITKKSCFVYYIIFVFEVNVLTKVYRYKTTCICEALFDWVKELLYTTIRNSYRMLY